MVVSKDETKQKKPLEFMTTYMKSKGRLRGFGNHDRY
jgi:hypothetical protein